MGNMMVTPNEETASFIRQGLKARDGYCPCIVEKSEDTKCPCKKFREKSICCCELYVNENDLFTIMSKYACPNCSIFCCEEEVMTAKDAKEYLKELGITEPFMFCDTCDVSMLLYTLEVEPVRRSEE